MIQKKTIKLLKLISLFVGILAGIATIIAIFPKPQSSTDLSGYWEMTFKVEHSSLDRYDNGNLEYKYRITLNQKDNNIEGKGEKFWENFKGVERFYNLGQKTPITLNGKLKKNIFSANIFEKGARRETTGFIEFKIKRKELNRIEGKFSSTAANSTGIAILNKVDD